MTAAQKESLRQYVKGVGALMDEFHHGDCVGADDMAADIVAEHGSVYCRIIVHPPADDALRAFNLCHHQAREPATHFARNRDIVNETDALIVCPAEMSWQPRGGTWYTRDFAAKQDKKIVIIWPNGLVQDHPEEKRV